jgi:hypothetical protein
LASVTQDDNKLAVRSSGGTAYTNVEGLLLRETDVRAAAKMTDSELVHRVKQGFQKIHDELPWIVELRKRFANRPRGKANISGCKTWIEFCTTVLNRSPRTIQRLLSEPDECDKTSHSEAGPANRIANVTPKQMGGSERKAQPGETHAPEKVNRATLNTAEKQVHAAGKPAPAPKPTPKLTEACSTLESLIYGFRSFLAKTDPATVYADMPVESKDKTFEGIAEMIQWLGRYSECAFNTRRK